MIKISESFSLKNFIRKPGTHQIWLIAIILFIAIIYSLISIVNHYLYRTYALDLGMFNHAAYSFANFKMAVFTLGVEGKEMPFLATHFSLISILYSPVYHLFGSYSLLVLQILIILFGGIGIYKIASQYFTGKLIIPLLLLIHFYCIWTIFSALSYDFHNHVIGAMLLPWFIYYLERRKLSLSILFLLLIIMCKEVMSIWMIFVIIGFMVKNRKKKFNENFKFEIPAILFCLVYAVIVIGYIMPSLQGAEKNLQLAKYDFNEQSIGGYLYGFIEQPTQILKYLFTNTTGDERYDWIKTEFHLMVLLSGGIALIFRPSYLIMLIPVYAQKFLSDDYSLWGINGHYSIEFAPILSLALINFLKTIKKNHQKVLIAFVTITIFANIFTIEDRKSKWYSRENTRFYNAEHYSAKLDINELNETLNLIDSKAAVSASSCLVPRLAFREKIYHFPIVKDAEYIALVTGNIIKYPLSEDAFKFELKKYEESDTFETIYSGKDIILLKKK